MTPDEFAIGMNHLEKIFNGGIEIGDELREEYYEAFRYVRPTVFRDAVQLVVETFKPFPSESFPAISTIENAIMESRDNASEEAGWETRRYPTPDYKVLDYCQRCNQIGLYLGDDGQAHFCVCEKGRIKRISWGIDAHVRKRDEKIQKALERLPASSGPVRGLHEWNPLGFFESTQAEHDRWMAAKRIEIEEIKRRQAEHPRGPTLPDELRRRLLKDTVAGVRGRMTVPVMREPGDDQEEDDSVPF